MKKTVILIMVVLVVVSISSLANAEIIELTLDCGGEYGLADTWTTNIDLGVSFTEISNIYINWSGTIIGQETMNSGVIDNLFVTTLYESNPLNYFGRAYVQGGAATYPATEPFDVQSVFTDEGWSALLDGQFNVEILFSETSHPLDITLNVPTGQLDLATLVVEGVIIPEPATLLFTVVGLAGLRANKCKGQRKTK